MQIRRYVIFEPASATPSKSGTKFIGLKSARKPTAPTMHFDEITDGKAQQLNRDGKPTAPVFPLRLIRPVNVGGAHKGPFETPWGLEAVGALSSPCRGEGATIAILDTGIDATHEVFAHMTGRIVQRDFAGDGLVDTDGHGTHCAGTVFGGSISGIRIGIAPGLSRALIGKVFNKGGASDTADLLKAITWAVEEGANVISMSLGMDFVGYQAQLMQQGMPHDIATSFALEGYLQNARLFGAVATMQKERAITLGGALAILAASGNESRRDDDKTFAVAVAPPAAGDGIVSVGALQRKGNALSVSSFSNAGPMVSAPGSAVLSARLGGGLEEMDGTSMATPHVAGVAALWVERWLEEKRLSAATFASMLIGQTKHIGGEATDVGAGMIWAPQ